MFRQTILALLIILSVLDTFAQIDAKPSKSFKKWLTQENGKIGILHYESAGKKEWYIQPEYDRVTAVKFEFSDPVYYKFWKNEIYDLVFFEVKPDGPHVIMVAMDVSDVKFSHTDPYLTYFSMGKWGCYYDPYLTGGSVSPAKYDTPPVLIDGYTVGTYVSKKYILVDSAGKRGLLYAPNNVAVFPGDYSEFLFNAPHTIITVGLNNLKGFVNHSGIVSPQYVDIKELSESPGSAVYFICVLPDSTRHIWSTTAILTNEELIIAARNSTVLKNIAKSLARKSVILGDLELEEDAERKGKICRAGTVEINEKFKSYFYDSTKKMCRFDLGEKIIFFYESAGRAKQCKVSLTKGHQIIDMCFANVKWPGETQASPQILIDSASKLVVINALNCKRTILNFSLTDGNIVYNGFPYRVYRFKSYSDITFELAKAPLCNFCTGTGSTQKVVKKSDEGRFETVTKTTYKEEKKMVERHTGGYDIVTTKVPVTTTEKVWIPSNETQTPIRVICEHCNGKGLVPAWDLIYWNGTALTH